MTPTPTVSVTRTGVPTFNYCLTGPKNGPLAGPATGGDNTLLSGTVDGPGGAHVFCFDSKNTSVGQVGTSYMLIMDQRLPFSCPGAPQCSTNVTGFSAVCLISYTEGANSHEGEMFSFAFADNTSKKYYQYFDSTLSPKSSGYVFPRDTLF